MIEITQVFYQKEKADQLNAIVSWLLAIYKYAVKNIFVIPDSEPMTIDVLHSGFFWEEYYMIILIFSL